MNVGALGVSFWVIVGLMVLSVALLSSFLASLYRKAGPHEALVVYGFRGTRVVKGHGTIIFPMIETCRDLSLELMSFDVAPQQDPLPITWSPAQMGRAHSVSTRLRPTPGCTPWTRSPVAYAPTSVPEASLIF